MLLSTLLLALRSIRRNLLRSFLTILGIVIGVSAVITMVTVGNGATLAVQNQIAGLGTNLLQIRPGQRMGGPGGGGGAPSFKEADADVITSQVGGLLAVAPEARASATIVADGRNWSSSVIGSTNNWLTTGNWKLADGRMFTEEEQRGGAAVCLIGETVRRELLGSGSALGVTIRVKQIACEVIGVLGSKGQGAFGNDQDDVVLVPLHTLQRRITGNTRVNTLLVSMQDGTDPERVKAALTQLLRERRKLAEADEDNFNVLDTKP
ncbi:MAG TPA: ABC transporter permease, partial [Rhodoferax sp.]